VNRRLLTTFLVCTSLAGAIIASSPVPAIALNRWIGFYQPGTPQQLGPLSSMEGELGLHIGVVNFFRCIEQGFTPTEVDNAAAHGSIPLITLEFCAEGKSGVVDQPAYRLSRITRGDFDSKIRAYADAARNSGHEIWIRPLHEMNGYWYPWSGTSNGNSPADFVPAWRHIHDIFVREGATNVKFVWCPNIESLPNTQSNSIAAYYPGDAYVDYMALDGYNFSTTINYVQWRSFESLFAAPYATLCSLSASKPIFVAETASVSTGGDKVGWIRSMFAAIPRQFPRIVGVSWFNSANSVQDWPMDSNSTVLQSYRLGVANGAYSPGLRLGRVGPALSINADHRTVRLRHRVSFSGVLTPGSKSDQIRVEIEMPHHRTTHATVRTDGDARWSFAFAPHVRGYYFVHVTYAGDATRLGTHSKTVRVQVK